MSADLRDGRPLPASGQQLRAEDIEVRYGELVALHGVSLRVVPGSFTAVTGPSGAGKTTLLWALAGMLSPGGGRVVLGEREVSGRADAANRGVALIPQGNGLASSLTAAENILAAVLAAGVPAGRARERVQTVLTAVGLEDSGGHLVEELSGGQQQRVAVARGLALDAGVLLADEPTSDLDAGNRELVVRLLREQADLGVAVVMATHDPQAAARAGAEVHLDEGVLTVVRDGGTPLIAVPLRE